MREFLILSPLDVPFTSLIVWVVVVGSIFKSLLEVNFLGLGEPSSGWFSPSVVELKEHVVKTSVSVVNRLNLVQMGGDVADFIKVLGPDLTDVQVDQLVVEGVNLGQLVLGQIFDVEPSLDVHTLVG